jgi:hypothetical protein
MEDSLGNGGKENVTSKTEAVKIPEPETDPDKLGKMIKHIYVVQRQIAEKITVNGIKKRVTPLETVKPENDISWDSFLVEQQLVPEGDIHGEVLDLFQENVVPSDIESGDVWQKAQAIMNGEGDKDIPDNMKGTTFELDIKTLLEAMPEYQNNWEKALDVTKLENFKVKIMVTKEFLLRSGGNLRTAFENAQVQVLSLPGWVSPPETMGSLGIRTLNGLKEEIKDEDGEVTQKGLDGILIAIERPGQGDSSFKEKEIENVLKDDFYTSLTNYNMTSEMLLRSMHLTPREGQVVLEQRHSTSAAAGLQKGRVEDPKTGLVMINPVLEQTNIGENDPEDKTRKTSVVDLKTRYLLGLGSHIAKRLEGIQIPKYIVKGVMNYYVGENRFLRSLYDRYYPKTDTRISSKFIRQLSGTVLETNNRNFDKRYNAIFVANKDPFVDWSKSVKAMRKAVGLENEEAVKVCEGDHHIQFSRETKAGEKAMDMVVDSSVQIARQSGRKKCNASEGTAYTYRFGDTGFSNDTKAGIGIESLRIFILT